MLKSINGIISSCAIESLDNRTGLAKDVFFNTKELTVAFVQVDFGFLDLSGKRVLVPTDLLRRTAFNDNDLALDITKQEIEESPEISKYKPISRQQKKLLTQYYHIESAGLNKIPHETVKPNSNSSDNKNGNASLLSFNSCKEFELLSTTGPCGCLDDLIIDDNSWRIFQIIINTNKFNPFGKRVMMDVEYLEKIDANSKKITVNLSSKYIIDSPEFNSENPVNKGCEKHLFDYYGRLVK